MTWGFGSSRNGLMGEIFEFPKGRGPHMGNPILYEACRAKNGLSKKSLEALSLFFWKEVSVCFSTALGTWCRAHNVLGLGHVLTRAQPRPHNTWLSSQ